MFVSKSQRVTLFFFSSSYQERREGEGRSGTLKESSEEGKMAGRSVRSGLVALKCGMMPVWDRWGARKAVTVLEVSNCQVMQVKKQATDG